MNSPVKQPQPLETTFEIRDPVARADQLDLFAILNGPDDAEAMNALSRTDDVVTSIGKVVDEVTAANPGLANLVSGSTDDVNLAMYLRSGGATLEAVNELISTTSDKPTAVMAMVAIADATPGATAAYTKAKATLGANFALQGANDQSGEPEAPKVPAKRGRKKGSGKAATGKTVAPGEETEQPEDAASDEVSEPAITGSEQIDGDDVDGPDENELNKAERQARQEKFEHAKAMQGVLNRLRGTRYDPPTAAHEIELGHLIQSGDAAARIELVERNTRLLVRIAARYRKTGRTLDDLFQAGSFGLMRAAELFDPTKGFRFSTYADAWIRQHISRFITNDELVRTPIHVVDKEVSLRKRSREAATAGDHELSKQLGKTAEEMRRARPTSGSFSAMDDPLGGDDDRTLHDLLMSEDVSLEQAAEAKKLVTWLMRAADNTANGIHGEIFKMRLGLHPEHENNPLTLLEISEIYKISRERVRQIFEKSVAEVAESVVYWAKGEENLPKNFFPLLKATYGRG